MIILRCVAIQYDSNYLTPGEEIYFLVQGETIESCRKRVYKYLYERYDHFKYELDLMDYMKMLYMEFSRWHKTPNNWGDLYNINFIKPNRAGIMEITKDMYNHMSDAYNKYY